MKHARGRRQTGTSMRERWSDPGDHGSCAARVGQRRGDECLHSCPTQVPGLGQKESSRAGIAQRNLRSASNALRSLAVRDDWPCERQRCRTGVSPPRPDCLPHAARGVPCGPHAAGRLRWLRVDAPASPHKSSSLGRPAADFPRGAPVLGCAHGPGRAHPGAAVTVGGVQTGDTPPADSQVGGGTRGRRDDSGYAGRSVRVGQG